MTLVMGPLPSAWNDQWIKIIQEKPGFDPEPRGEPRFQPLRKTFEQRRHFIITLAEKDEDFEKPDFIEDDYQGLSCLLSVMEGLMQHEPQKRITSGEALARMHWIDQWVYNESENEEE
uniref:Protein kinase domain-containing protein n=1 Tax=Bionectria ochroleuca TaxID=29856 RepID=A0A8H7KA72_BIOOC